MKKVKCLFKRIIYGKKASDKIYASYLRKIGMKIGDNFYAPVIKSIPIDETRPWLIEIGNDVTLTKGVTILTHGYDLSVIMKKTGLLYGSSGKVKIGNNVFVGVNSTILKGVSIGNNVIIGANSLVNKDIPDNVVAAGNPIRIIMTLDEYIVKREKECIEEAKELAIEYYKRYNKKPTLEQFHEFFFLMVDRNEIDNLKFDFLEIKEVRKKFQQTNPIYKNLEEFLEDCGI